MDPRFAEQLRADGYERYIVAKQDPDKPWERVDQALLDRAQSLLDQAAGEFSDGYAEYHVDGSVRESASGGTYLYTYICMKDEGFVVYLPPEDSEFGSKSRLFPPGQCPGYRPSQEVAEMEFRRWLKSLR